jgi:hypothetical protein
MNFIIVLLYNNYSLEEFALESTGETPTSISISQIVIKRGRAYRLFSIEGTSYPTIHFRLFSAENYILEEVSVQPAGDLTKITLEDDTMIIDYVIIDQYVQYPTTVKIHRLEVIVLSKGHPITVDEHAYEAVEVKYRAGKLVAVLKAREGADQRYKDVAIEDAKRPLSCSTFEVVGMYRTPITKAR